MPSGHGLAATIGTTSACIVCMGNSPPDNYTRTTTQWNGSSWTAGGTVNREKGSEQQGFGIVTAAVITCGYDAEDPVSTFTTFVEEYNGTAWTEVNNTSDGRQGGSAAGTEAAGFIFGGAPPLGLGLVTEEYDGTSWAAGGSLTTGRERPMGDACGTQTAALCIGGYTTTAITTCEEYGGTSWTAGGALNTAMYNGGCSGTQTAGLSFAGNNPGVNICESYNGTAWTAEATLATGRGYCNGTGTGTSAFLCGGGYPFTGPAKTLVEEWTSGNSVITFTDS